jgi:hypothetical protein
VNNLTTPDDGDSYISDCLFADVGNFLNSWTSSGVLWQSSGGLRILNNKFQGGGVGINLDATTFESSILIVTGNSFENFAYYGVWAHVEPGGTFPLINITGNEFGTYHSGAQAGLIVDAPTIKGITVTGNTFNNVSGVGAFFNNGTNAAIATNSFNATNGVSGTAYGIFVASGFGQLTIGENDFSATYPIYSAPIYSAASSTRMLLNYPFTWVQVTNWLSPSGASNGSRVYCSDCRGAADASYVAGAACTGSGSGAMAQRISGSWRCW